MSIKLISRSILILLLCASIIFPSQIMALFEDLNDLPNLTSKTGLSVGFYDDKCPIAEQIVKYTVWKAFLQDSGIAAGLLRLYFHDCFVNGCDASVLLDSTPSGEPTEKNTKANTGLRGFEVIDDAKSTLEILCPNTVSCADIIAFAVRDAVTLAGIQAYPVPAGRRDGLVSLASNVASNLARPDSEVAQMEAIFKKKNLDVEDLVVLLGAHSIGVVHCFVINDNLYNFNGTHMANPKINKMYLNYMKSICPPPDSSTSNDTAMPLNNNLFSGRLTNKYYRNVANGRVALTSDQSLMGDPRTRQMVKDFGLNPFKWSKRFQEAMIKMGNVEVLTGKKGQIRRSCRAVNE